MVRGTAVLVGLLLLATIGSQVGSGRAADPPALFQTSDRCLACHNGLSTASGEDVSIGSHWRASMMANSARDPYWQAAVRRETIDHPKARAAIEDECAVCHMPMSRMEARLRGHEAEVFAHLPLDAARPAGRLAADGVSCTVCHQIEPDKLGTKDSFVGRFVINTTPGAERRLYGPFDVDTGRAHVMRSSTGFRPVEAAHIQKSEVCATCHTLYTRALGPDGQVIGELPEQVPYQEWLHSEFRAEMSCQSCHMPAVAEETPVTSVLGKPRPALSRHFFTGGNFFLLGMLDRYRDELGVVATAEEFRSNIGQTLMFLRSSTAELAVENVARDAGRLIFQVAVRNLSGHKLPTAYPSRRVWLHVVVRDRTGRVVFESGAINAQGAIAGNDNDSDPGRYEPHHAVITGAGQVQIYESMMADSAGSPTTGLLSAVRYLKDNRLLPRGFDKRTADQDVAVRGAALDDPDFAGGGDRVRYSIAVGEVEGPLEIDAELWYQPVSFRWAENLRRYESVETDRFVRYFASMSSGSAALLVRASAAH